MKHKVDFGRAIKFVREKKGLNQEQLGNKVDSNQPYISQIERGVFNPSIKFIEKICKALNIPFVFMVWHSMTEENISEEKREAFKMLKPSIDNIFNDLLK